MSVSWLALQRQLDQAADNAWGERALLLPWKAANLTGGGKPDTTRPARTATVYFFTSDSMITTGGGNTAAFNSRMALADAGISLTVDQLGGVGLKEGDHVIMLDQNFAQYSVSYASPSATRRPRFALVLLPAGVASRFITANQTLEMPT